MKKLKRKHILFKGIIQGVGFRPYIYKISNKYNITGFVKNTSEGVVLEVEGKDLEIYLKSLIQNIPPIAKITDYSVKNIPIMNSKKFIIKKSKTLNINDVLISPDIKICKDCIDEFNNLKNKRYLYPFINCTNCGPRFSIIKNIPYDRKKTTMNKFKMCNKCKNEYEDPLDRRFHAQPISCYNCGPELEIYDKKDKIEVKDKIQYIVDKINTGNIIAIKGLSGYHLACDSRNESAINDLRKVKNRGNKPFALMAELSEIEKHCMISQSEKNLLQSENAPIVILKNKSKIILPENISPGTNYLGFMLPYTPLHLSLFKYFKAPLIMTSANISNTPIIYKDNIKKLRDISDYILTNNRKIYIFADDSVSSIFEGESYIIRRSRGYIPQPIELKFPIERKILALGPMMKTTFTIIKNNNAFVSQYIGRTDNIGTIEAEKKAIDHYMKLFSFYPELIAIDKHPLYPNRMLLNEYSDIKHVEIQHHKAHIVSLLAEKGVNENIIGICFDGTGYGDDGAIWGGEFFIGNYKKLKRVGHIKYNNFPLGEKAVVEPWIYVLSLLNSIYGDKKIFRNFSDKFKNSEIVLNHISKTKSIQTSSCGRLFDVIACILGLGNVNTYEGELPILLQSSAEKHNINDIYKIKIEDNSGMLVLNILDIVKNIFEDKREVGIKAMIFHNTIAESILKMCNIIREKYNINKVCFSGGVFQNLLLLSKITEKMKNEKYEVVLHSKVSPNDSGLSLGQAVLAAINN